jgi:hypothetical protein
MLYLKCKKCGVRFPSGMNIDKESFKTTMLIGNYHDCPKGHTEKYDKKDYFYDEKI